MTISRKMQTDAKRKLGTVKPGQHTDYTRPVTEKPEPLPQPEGSRAWRAAIARRKGGQVPKEPTR